MGVRQNVVKHIISQNYSEYKHPKINKDDLLDSGYYSDCLHLYKNLGGQYSEPPVNFGSWDISTKEFLIELDEERHFNRYRRLTLDKEKFDTEFSKSTYSLYCDTFESNCIKAASWGGNWKNNSTERMFLKSNLNGNLSGNGSSRWRQRAYYDFLKDISAKILRVPLYRISIYDTYKEITIGNLLKDSKFDLIQEYLEITLT